MIHFDQVSKRYPGGHEALSNLSFEVAAGEMVYVTGHSGAGKTSLVASYVEARKRSGVWYHVDGGAHESLAFCQRNHSRPRRSSSSPMTAPAIIATMWEGGCCRRGVVMPRR